MQVGSGRNSALGHVEEDLWDLENFVKVLLGAVAVFENFVLVAGELEPFFLPLDAYDGDVGELDLVGGLLWVGRVS